MTQSMQSVKLDSDLAWLKGYVSGALDSIGLRLTALERRTDDLYHRVDRSTPDEELGLNDPCKRVDEEEEQQPAPPMEELYTAAIELRDASYLALNNHKFQSAREKQSFDRFCCAIADFDVVDRKYRAEVSGE